MPTRPRIFRSCPDFDHTGECFSIGPPSQSTAVRTIQVSSLGVQIAQSRYYLQTLDPKVGTICILGALGVSLYVADALAGPGLIWVDRVQKNPRL